MSDAGSMQQPPRPPLQVARRNSFSRDMTAAVAQARTQSFDATPLDSIQLHVKDALRSISPRKSASFSLPKTPRQSGSSTSDSPVAELVRSLRPTSSDSHIRRSFDNGNDGIASRVPQYPSSDGDDSPYLFHQIETANDVLLLDSPTQPQFDSPESSVHSDESGENSPSSSTYSPVSPTRGSEDDDTFASWLQEANTLDPTQLMSSVQPATTIEEAAALSTRPEVSKELSAWLLRERTPSIPLSKSIQQIEHEIRHAIDSAATRVTSDLQRRDQFEQQLHDVAGGVAAVATVGPVANVYEANLPAPQQIAPPMMAGTFDSLVATSEPELLLLMEVLIGDGRSETIEVHVGDQPERLAEAFAVKHGLGMEAIPQLTQHIQEQVNALREEEQAVSDGGAGGGLDDIGDCGVGGHDGQQLTSGDADDDGLHRMADDLFDDYKGCDMLMSKTPPSTTTASPPPPAPVEFADATFADVHDDKGNPRVQQEPEYREHEREHSYNHLMEKYGHYTSHSNKVNPMHGVLKDSSSRVPPRRAEEEEEEDRGFRDDQGSGDPLTMRNLQLSERTRLVFTPRPAVFASSHAGKSHAIKDKDTVYNRLYSLAEAREKWMRRQQKAKAADEMKERQALMKLEISAKSRDMVAGRTNGGFANIGERLHDEALTELAKKQRQRDKRTLEKAQEVDWTCPKCAFFNHHNDDVCKNIVASLPPPVSPTQTTASRRESCSNPSAIWQSVPLEVLCGHVRPVQLFRPTLIAVPTTAARAVHHHQLRTSSSAGSSGNQQSQRRQRTQLQMEEEFKQTCPFHPKINALSEEIMRDKLEQEAKAAAVKVKSRGGDGGGGASVSAVESLRRKNPHQALYEDAFHAKANREVKEQEYMSQFSFKPNIGVNALWSNRNEEDVVERLAVSKYQELERKRLSLHEKYTPDRDPTTGREYFKPETGRAPIFNRNERGLPIGEFLYEAHKEHADYHRRLRQQEADQIKQQSEQRFLSDRSKQALEVRKNKTFARIFACLIKLPQQRQQQEGIAASCANPVDQDTHVMPDAVDLSKLPPEISRIVSIVFEFANHEPFSFAEFEQYMEKLLVEVPGLTYTQVMFLTESLNDGKSSRPPIEKATDPDNDALNDPDLTFHPAIDKNSDALAKKHGRADRAKVFQALNHYYSHYKDRQELAKKQLDREFVRTHPFQPTFVSKDRKKKAANFYDKLHRSEKALGIGTHAQKDLSTAAPALRTALPNARPFVRPIDRGHHYVAGDGRSSSSHLRSRSSSLASSKHSDDEDAVLTSRVLAALECRPQQSQTQPSPPTMAFTRASTSDASNSLMASLFPSGSASVESGSLATMPTEM